MGVSTITVVSLGRISLGCPAIDDTSGQILNLSVPTGVLANAGKTVRAISK